MINRVIKRQLTQIKRLFVDCTPSTPKSGEIHNRIFHTQLMSGVTTNDSRLYALLKYDCTQFFSRFLFFS